MRVTQAISSPAANDHKQESLFWWTPLVIIFIIALGLRTVYIDNDMPANDDPDEHYYFAWARQIRQTGRPDIENGTGYPPGLLYMLAAEQVILETIRGPEMNRSTEYYIFARIINGIFGSLSIFLIAILTRQIVKSRLAGIASAFLIATIGLMVSESRRGAANALWLFFSFLSFIALFHARDTRKLTWLYTSVLLGTIAFLFKYQFGVFFCLPFIFAWFYFRDQKNFLVHVGIFATALFILLLWLIFDYRIFEIVNTPSSDTISAVQDGEVVGFQTILTNWRVIANATGSILYIWGVLGAVALAALSLKFRKLNDYIDRSAVFSLLIFSVLFYVLMSLFRTTASSKWLVTVAVLLMLALTFIVAASKLVGDYLSTRFRQPNLSTIVPGLVLLFYMTFVGIQQVRSTIWVYEHVWTKPTTLNKLNAWYAENVPQGGRIVSEINKMINNYDYAPPTVHALLVNSIFEEPVANYRNRGYDYLIWNNRKSYPTDTLADLDARIADLEAQGAQEVLRLTGDEVTGSDFVVFKIDPLPENEVYAWFSDSISFRGYDLARDTFKAGELLDLTLYWESSKIVPNNYMIFVHLVDPQTDHLVTGQDGPPDNGLTPTWKWQGDMQFIRDQRTLPLPANLKPGTYNLQIGMYDADTKARVTILDLKNQPIGDGFVLQDIKIEQ